MQKVKGFAAKNLVGIPTTKMSRAEWVSARTQAAQNAVGGSEIGVLLRLDNRFSSPIRMFYERLGLWEARFEDNQYSFMGRSLESTIVNLWRHWQGDWESTMAAYDQGRKSRRSRACKFILFNPEFPHQMANIDNKILFSPDSPTGKGILEAKTLSGHASDRYSTGIPPKHIAQVQDYLLITGEEYGELAVLKNGVEFQVYPIEANTGIQNAIVSAVENFFSRVECARREIATLGPYAEFEEKIYAAQVWEPPVEAADDEYEFLSEKAKRLTMAGDFEPDEKILGYFEHALDFADREKEAEERKQWHQNQIRQDMTARGIYRYSWKEGVITNGKRFTLKRRKVK